MDHIRLIRVLLKILFVNLRFRRLQKICNCIEHTPHQLFNMHPGSHVGQGIEAGIEQIAEVLNAVLKEDQTTTLLLETMAR